MSQHKVLTLVLTKPIFLRTVKSKVQTTTLGGFLKGHRKLLGKSLQDVHADTGLAMSFLSYCERNVRRPSATNLVAWCASIGAPVDRAINLAKRGCADCSDYDAALAEYNAGQRVAS